MDEDFRRSIVAAYAKLPEGCRCTPASDGHLQTFENEFGPIPTDFRWFLTTCGGGVCGSEWIDGISELAESHRKFNSELALDGWTMRGVFPIGWDGAGNPFGIEVATGRVLVEDHNFGGIHENAESFESLLKKGLLRDV